MAVSFLRWIQLTEGAESIDDADATAHLQECLKAALGKQKGVQAPGKKNAGKGKKRAADVDVLPASKVSPFPLSVPPVSLSRACL